MTDWFSYDNSRTGKPFNCKECNREVAANEKRWWNKNDKSTICNDCYLKKSPNIPNTPSTTQTAQTTTKCDVCGDAVTASKEVHHILRGGKWWTVCFYCFNTVRRVRALKVAGLWPFEKKKDVGEQYDLAPSTTPSVGSPLVSKEADRDG